MYLIGHITSTHGIRGELKVHSLSDFERFKPGKTVYIAQHNDFIPFEIESVRPHQQRLLVKFLNMDNINDVLMYKGLDLYTDEKPEETLENDEYLYEDLIDKKVLTENGEIVGVVSSMIEVPQGHLMEVKKNDHKKIMIPFVSAFIIDIDDEKIIIKPIEGLL